MQQNKCKSSGKMFFQKAIGTLVVALMVITITACSAQTPSSNEEVKTDTNTVSQQATDDQSTSQEAAQDEAVQSVEATPEQKEEPEAASDEPAEEPTADDEADLTNEAGAADEVKQAASSETPAAKDEASAEPVEEAETVQVDFEVPAWAESKPCAACHTKQADTLADMPCEAALGDEACVRCHTDEALEDIHADVTPDDRTPRRLKKSAVPGDGCLACHDGLDVLAEVTADSTVLTDSNGTTVNPHDLPANEHHETIVCGDCHSMHKSGDPAETAPGACKSCHHTGVYECGTCHESKL